MLNNLCPSRILAAEPIALPKDFFIPVLILSAPAPEARGFTKGKSFYAPLPYKKEKEIKINNNKRNDFV